MSPTISNCRFKGSSLSKRIVAVAAAFFWLLSTASVNAQVKAPPKPNPGAAVPNGNMTSTTFYSWVPARTNHTHYSNVWTTIAGTAGVSGSKDGTNHEAQFNQPMGLAMDNAGKLYVADTLNHTIRQMYTNGSTWNISTIAGTPGVSGSSDGTNAAARFNHPTGIAVDGVGNLFVADSLNNTIRKITPNGANWVVTTIAGLPGTNGFRDGTNRIARFNRPMGIAIDPGIQGILYVADTFNHTIREIRPEGTNWIVKTIAGSPLTPGRNDGVRWAAHFNRPTGITRDDAGNLYVADELNCTIRKLRLFGTNWVVNTIAGLAGVPGSDDGAISWDRLGNPCGISIDAGTNLYVSDFSNCNIRKMTPSGTNWIATSLGGRVGTSGTNDGIPNYVRFSGPSGIAVNPKGSTYFVVDSLNNTIRIGGGKSTDTNIFLGHWIVVGREAHGIAPAAH